MRFVTIFPETENLHLIKDVGMIPYIMHKEFNYESKIVCYENGVYPYLDKEVKGLKIDFIKKFTKISVLDGAIYLFKNSNKIDILNLFHFNIRTSLWICIYKFFNKKGKIYMKLDVDYHIKKSVKPNSKSLKSKFKKFILKKCNLVSVETSSIYNFLKENWKINVEYIPNGFYDYKRKQIVSYDIKENIVLTVGRIGTYQKATEILLEGFKKASNEISNWKLKVIGPIEKDFQEYIDKFFNNNPDLKNKIEFTGAIYDREKLRKEYEKAKIFCMTSRYESFGLVFLEAMQAGCYIISSNIESSFDITNNENYGSIFSIDDVNELKKCLIKSCNDKKLSLNCFKMQQYVYEQFYWPVICKKILIYLN